ncbi:hypothetical protein EYF80_012039 [Liparis tanakae]|uniref:Uncharacterized protein n=1 Tax=Liparis tanakae TaxID=230148 RepID=A0A4Z2IJ13_9TELE|nr:hypothetical protein EYF80_012039 [Liparis tanakae]
MSPPAVGAPVNASFSSERTIDGGMINIDSSQLGREVSRRERAIVSEGSETLTSQQGPSSPTGT